MSKRSDKKLLEYWQMKASQNEGFIKVSLRTVDEEDEIVETPWAKVAEKPFTCYLENSPFFAAGIAAGDLVEVEVDNEGIFWITNILEPCGGSTVFVYFPNDDSLEELTPFFAEKKCWYEGMNSGFLSVNVPLEVSLNDFIREVESKASLGIDYEITANRHGEK